MPRPKKKIDGAKLAAVPTPPPAPAEDPLRAAVGDPDPDIGTEAVATPAQNRAQLKRERKANAIAAANAAPPPERPTIQMVVPPHLLGPIHASAAAVQLAEAEAKAAQAVLQAAHIARQNELVNVADQMGLRPSEVVKFDNQPNGSVILVAYAKE